MKLLLLSAILFVVLYIAVFWLIVIVESRRTIPTDPKPKRFPDVSVIVPAYNEEKHIEPCLKSILSLNYPKKLRVIVVDDGSTDRTYALASRFKPRITLIHKENGGKASAMNVGLKYVKTDFVACMDADSIVSKDALMHMMGYFDDPQIGAVTPAMKVIRPKNLTQSVQWIEYLVGVLQRKLFAVLNVIYVTPGPFSVYRTALLRKLGGFDEKNLTEDMEIALGIQDLGYKIENSVYAYVHTHSPFTWAAFFKQRTRWYRGLYQNVGKYRHMLFSKKHGLLGVWFLPLTLLSIVVSIAAAALSIWSLGEWFYDMLKQLYYAYTVSFDVLIPKFNLDIFILAQNPFLGYLSVFLLATTFLVLYISHKVGKERLSMKMKLAYVSYILIYYILLAGVWLVSFIYEARHAERRW